MTATDTLKTAVAELAQVRADCIALNEAMHNARAAFNEQHAPLIHAISDHAARLAEAEALVRALALACHKMDPTTTTPVPGADIVIRTTWTYAEPDALAWAEVALPGAITRKLDTKAIDKIASTGVLPFATKVETPAVRIATDLSAHLTPVEVSNV